MINKILFFGNYPNQVEKNLNVFFQNLIFQFADMGIECTVIDPVSITKYKTRINEIPYHRIEVTPNGGRVIVYSPRYFSFSNKKIGIIDTHTWTVRSYRRSAIKVVKRHNLHADVTYGHFINIGGIPACVAAGILGCKSFVANGESDLNPATYNYNSHYGLLPFKQCAGVISVSSKNKEELENLHLIPSERIRVFPNSVDLNMFHPVNREFARKELGFPDNEIIACYVGGFSERKGHERVMAAARIVKGLKLAFAGSGGNPPSGENVIFCKSMNHKDLPVLLSACDFFVLPTLNEGCCNAIIEALACGLPVVSSDLPFNYDILDDMNSILIDPLSLDEIANAMQLLVDDEQLRRKMSDSALRTAQKFDVKTRAFNILNYMEKTIEQL